MPDEFAHGVFTAVAFVLAHTILADPVAVKSVTVAGTRFPVTLATQAGHPFDTRVVESDVQKLWATRRFDDIQVESTDGAIVFRVREARQMQLREIHIEPNNFGLHPKIAAGTPMNVLRAHEIAMEAQKHLNAEGYLRARVDATFVPVAPSKVDLRLTVHAGQPVDLKASSSRAIQAFAFANFVAHSARRASGVCSRRSPAFGQDGGCFPRIMSRRSMPTSRISARCICPEAIA
jgi:outer membrane protein assembly factor BamA